MNNAYSEVASSQAYKDFLASDYGQEFKAVLGQAYLDILEQDLQKAHNTSSMKILDAGCGNGWLAGLTAEKLTRATVFGCDLGEPLIQSAKVLYPKVAFQLADLTSPLPYEEASFDYILSSMVLHDTNDETKTLQNLARVLKPDGKLYATIVNPYYGYPVGVWKRGFWGFLFRRRPKLKFSRNYNQLRKWNKVSFAWRPYLHSYFTPFSKHIISLRDAGLYLDHLVELNSTKSTKAFSLNYQLHQFPVLLLLSIRKLPK